jgi:hypothetical protein
MTNIRTQARWAARNALEQDPTFSGWIGDICMRLEDSKGQPQAAAFRALTWSSLVGACRAAARSLGRYDAKTDSVTAA